MHFFHVMYYINPLLIVSPSCFAFCGHYLSPRAAVVVSLFSSVFNLSISHRLRWSSPTHPFPRGYFWAQIFLLPTGGSSREMTRFSVRHNSLSLHKSRLCSIILFAIICLSHGSFLELRVLGELQHGYLLIMLRDLTEKKVLYPLHYRSVTQTLHVRDLTKKGYRNPFIAV